MLKSYRFDAAKQSEQWATVNDIAEELHHAYAQLLALPGERSALKQTATSAPLYQIRSGEGSVPDSPSGHEDKAVSHRQSTEQALRAYRNLAAGTDEDTAKTRFIELVATRGFSDSQSLPSNSQSPPLPPEGNNR